MGNGVDVHKAGVGVSQRGIDKIWNIPHNQVAIQDASNSQDVLRDIDEIDVREAWKRIPLIKI